MKQIAWVYVLLTGLAVAFGVICIAIFLFGPRPSLVAKKLRFGAMIIAFNTMLTGCYGVSNPDRPVPRDTDSVSSTESGNTADTDITDTDSEADAGSHTDAAVDDDDTDISCYVPVL